MNNLGQYIAEHRVKHKLSIRRLAELAHVSHTEIYRIEHGERKNPSASVLKCIANALKENYNDILKAAGYIDTDMQYKVDEPLFFNIEDLTDREVEEVQDFIDFLRNRRKKGVRI